MEEPLPDPRTDILDLDHLLNKRYSLDQLDRHMAMLKNKIMEKEKLVKEGKKIPDHLKATFPPYRNESTDQPWTAVGFEEMKKAGVFEDAPRTYEEW